MSEHIVLRIDPIPERRADLERWLLGDHLASVRGVAGLAAPVIYRACHVETPIRTYRQSPELTVIYPVASGASVHGLAVSEAFLGWWSGSITTRFRWVAAHDWVATRRIFGPPEAIAGDRVLLTQVHVASGHEAGWARWYRDRHVPDALAVPGFFAGPMWQLEAFDVNTDGWHVSPRPRFTHVLPLTADADWVAGPGSSEFLALAADTQTTWAGAIEHVVSQLCERVA